MFWRTVVPIGMFVAFTVVLPALLHILLRPQDVSRTLEFDDARPRWTNGRSVRRGVVVAIFVTLATAVGLFLVLGIDSYAADRHIYLTVPYALAGAMALLAAGCALAGHPFWDRAAIVLVALMLIAFAYVGVVRHPYHRYLYTDRTVPLCVFISVDTIAAGLLLRETRRVNG